MKLNSTDVLHILKMNWLNLKRRQIVPTKDQLRVVHHKITQPQSLKDINVILRRTNFDIMTDRESTYMERDETYSQD